MKEKIYLSGSIAGTGDYIECFQKAEKELTENGFSVVNPASVNSMLPEDTTYEQYMDMAFTMLKMCGHIYMLEGWEKSRGANREYGYAVANDMTIWYQEA